MTEFAHLVANYVIVHKDALLALVGGGAGISAFGQVALHKISTKWHVDSKGFSYSLIQVLTAIAAVAAYLVGNANLLEAYPLLATFVATIHRYMVSPYYTKKIVPYLEYQASQKAIAVQPTAAPALSPEAGQPSFAV